MNRDGGGQVIPDSFVEQLAASQTSANPFRSKVFARMAAVKPPTRRQRLRVRIWDLRYRIAHAIYPFHEGDD